MTCSDTDTYTVNFIWSHEFWFGVHIWEQKGKGALLLWLVVKCQMLSILVEWRLITFSKWKLAFQGLQRSAQVGLTIHAEALQGITPVPSLHGQQKQTGCDSLLLLCQCTWTPVVDWATRLGPAASLARCEHVYGSPSSRAGSTFKELEVVAHWIALI